MKTIDELNKRKTPIVIIDEALDKIKNEPLFQDKLDKANETLRKTKLPKLKTS